jgi:hypothetical protein
MNMQVLYYDGLTLCHFFDSKQQYLMQFKAGSTPYLILNEENLPLAINTTEIPEAEEIDLPEAQAAAPTALETKAAQQVISKEMAQSQTIIIQNLHIHNYNAPIGQYAHHIDQQNNK